jgi:light-regulated signal transduction histidine kinase (bacteriophytochrome)
LEYLNKELETVSYSVSHDLRAPIRAINGFAQVLEEDYTDKFDLKGVKALQNSSRMGILIDDLLSFFQTR